MALNPVRILGDIIVGIVKLLLGLGMMKRMMAPIVGLGFLLGFWEDEEDDWSEKPSIQLVNRQELSDLMEAQDVILNF